MKWSPANIPFAFPQGRPVEWQAPILARGSDQNRGHSRGLKLHCGEGKRNVRWAQKELSDENNITNHR